MSRDPRRPVDIGSNADDSAELTPPPARPPPRLPTSAEYCRTLAAEAHTATLATIAREPEGFPYGSLVTVAVDDSGRPLLLLSKLAEHTQNLERRGDASILLTEPLDGHRQPLTLGRVTLLGPCRRISEEDITIARRTFLAVHPDASAYVDFKDFVFYRLEPISLRYVGGFARASWVSAEEYRAAEPDPLRSAAASILSHMNEDHAEALIAYARGLARIPEASAATMTAVDRYGFELIVTTPTGPKATRLAFDREVSTSEDVRNAMVAMVKAARSLLC